MSGGRKTLIALGFVSAVAAGIYFVATQMLDRVVGGESFLKLKPCEGLIELLDSIYK